MARSLKVQKQPKGGEPLTPEILGAFVRAKRTQSGLRIDDAAQLCGVSVETLSRIETTKASVHMESLFKVLHGLGIELYVKPWSEESMEMQE